MTNSGTSTLAYLSEVRRRLDALEEDVSALALAAQWCADSVMSGGLVHLFGAGHSHMAAEEAFHRAGGLVPVNAVLVDWLMVHSGPRAALLERQAGLGELIVATEPVEPGDVFFVVSNSGRNPVPTEVAEAAKERGARVVAVVSREHSAGVTARGGRDVKLVDVADLVLDNHAPLGDAAVEVGAGFRAGGMSNVMSLVIVQTVMVETIKLVVGRGAEPPVFKSANVDGSDQWNAEQVSKLRRTPTLLRGLRG
jgi:uncharacterized phosphosugar-binding protein